MVDFDRSGLLLTTLEAAVPLEIAHLQQLKGETRDEEIMAWARAAVDPIASRSDILQFGGRKGITAEVFGHMARGLAALAHSPGGVLFRGIHWCVEHPSGRRVASITDLTCGRAEVRPPLSDRPAATVNLPEVPS